MQCPWKMPAMLIKTPKVKYLDLCGFKESILLMSDCKIVKLQKGNAFQMFIAFVLLYSLEIMDVTSCLHFRQHR